MNLAPAVASLALAGALTAQDLGRGSLGSHGREPQLALRSAAAGGQLRFDVADLQPGSQVFLLLAAAPAAIPLDALVRGAVLGLDPASLSVTGPFAADRTGRAVVQVRVAPSWVGTPLFVQALAIDTGLRPPIAFSDSRSMTVGSADPELVLTRGTAPWDIVRLFPDGRAGTPAPFLRNVTLHDLDLASLDESRAFRRDLPRPLVVGGRRAVQLADGSTVLRYATRGRSGLLRVHRDGRLEVLHESVAGVQPFVAAAPAHVAFATAAGRLYLYRLAGNWARSASASRDVTPAVGLAVDAESVVFGSRVLTYVDKVRGPFLVRLADGSVLVPKLPRSGGRDPAVFDEEIGVSGDGRSFVFGAGSGKKTKDVYVVYDDGRAVNVTRRVSDYAEVGYSNPGRRTELILNHDGSQVAWVDEGGKEPEGYTSRVALPRPVHLTTSRAFVDSIDVGSTTRMPVRGGGLIIAGLNESRLDVFFTPSLSDSDVIALTKTGTATRPPFGRDSKLALLDLASLSSTHQFVTHAKHAQQSSAWIYVIDTVARSARIAARQYAGHGAALGGTRFVVDDGAAIVVVDPRDTTATFAKRVPLGQSGVAAMSVDPSSGQVAVAAGDLWLVTTKGTPVARRLTSNTSGLGGVLAGHLSGQVHALSPPGANGRTLLRWRASAGLEDVGGTRLAFFLLGR